MNGMSVPASSPAATWIELLRVRDVAGAEMVG